MRHEDTLGGNKIDKAWSLLSCPRVTSQAGERHVKNQNDISALTYNDNECDSLLK